jgi:tetratricopeptide (TPR) repeat protein
MKKLTLLTTLILLTILGCNDNRHQSLGQLDLGKKHLENDKFDSSLTCLYNAIKLDSLNSEAYYYLGKINYQIDNYNEGFKYVNIAEKQNFNADSIEVLKLKILFAMNKYDDCIEYCNKLISKNSSNHKMYLYKAKALYNKANNAKTIETRVMQLKEALENVNISLNLNKDNNETFVIRGAIRYRLTDNKGAIGDFDMAISKEKKDSSIISNAYRFKGLAKKALKNLNDAELLLDSAIIFQNKTAELYINRGDIKISLNKTDLACADYRKAFELGYKDAIDRIREDCK